MALIKDILESIRGLLRERQPLPRLSPEERKALFRSRYQAFRRLLAANNESLEIMADMEEALRGSRVFGMSFVRSHCTAVSVNVYKLAANLVELAPGRYDALLERFHAIRGDVEALLSSRREAEDGPLVLDLSEIDKDAADMAGGKMANIGEIKNHLGLPTPEGFVVTAAACRAFMRHGDLQADIDARMTAADEGSLDSLYRLSSAIQQRIIQAELPPALDADIRTAHDRLRRKLGAEIRVSLRSSALGEDAAGATFAGQFRSVLNVGPEGLAQAYKEVVASKYGLPAMTYRVNRGIRDEDVAMCVGCMAMVEARAGGVAYSRNPVDVRDDRVFINAVWGLPKSVVDGSAEADEFVVERLGQTDELRLAGREIRSKRTKIVRDVGEGVRRIALPRAEAEAPVLQDEQAVRLAEMAIRLERHYGLPQDIEWALDQAGNVVLLQCRPLQQTEGTAERPPSRAPEGAELIFSGGAAASPGVGCGPVFVARGEADALRFPEGGVLVAAQSLPRWAALLHRAAAVVAEQGGVTGHLANVAREFGVPALFDVQDATTILEEGSEITVDVDARRVWKGRVESLLSESVRGNLMLGSPVHEALREVSRLILPLNLVDPAASGFTPEGCRTYHDITRFAHEMSVREMFEFGKTHGSSAMAGKRLYCGQPTQWWVIDLADGFSRPIEDRCVDIKDVVSAPMLALWAGITAIAWTGPPPVSAKGMMSVFFEATMNADLEPASGSDFAADNVFLVARDYCCLNSRFGFHFTTVEGLAGERPQENFVSFKFSGGAADLGRRRLRAELIAELLERHGFSTTVKDDVLFARVERLSGQATLERLRLVGYLLMHTRQMDMIMTDAAAVAAQRAKLLADIAALSSASLSGVDAPPSAATPVAE